MTPEDERRRSATQLLRDPRFGRYFLGSLLSNSGTWCHDIAAAIFVFQVTGLASMVALVAVAAFGASVVLAPVGGLLADRFDRRMLLLVSLGLQALISATFAAFVLSGVNEVWLVLAVTLILGAGRAVNTPALQAYLPSLVPLRDLAQASALYSVTFNVARAVGPALGALLITQWGAGIAFAANAASFAAFGLILLSLTSERSVRPKRAGGILGGLAYVRTRSDLIVLLLIAGVVGMATDPVITLGPSFAARFDQPPEYAGLLVTAFGVGSILAAPFIGRLRVRVGPVRTATIGFAGIAVGFAVTGVVPHHLIALGAVAFAGFCYLATSSDITTSLLERLDDSVRGRVMALWAVGFHGARPIAALIDGGIADRASPGAAIIAMASLMFATAAALLLWRWRGPRSAVSGE